MIVRPSPQLDASILDILKNKEPGLMTIQCTLFNPDAPHLQITPFRISNFVVKQMFATAYMDEIELSVEVTPQMYIDLMQNYQNLHCSLVLEYVEQHTSKALQDRLPRKFLFLALIADMADLLKKYNINELIAEKEEHRLEAHQARMIPLKFQLFEETAYQLRHIQINGLLNDVRMIDVLHYICNLAQLKKIKIIPPDNTKVYRTMSLPPMLGVAANENNTDAFIFLQERFGLYGKGLGYYFVQDTMYVYPAYDTQPTRLTTPQVVHIYNAPAGNYVGSDAYHCYKDGDLHLVSNGQVELKDFTDGGMENYGTSIVTLRADTTLDLNAKTDGTGSQFNPKTTIGCGLNTKRGLTSKSSNNTRYTSSTNNLFYEASAMAAYHCVMAVLPWSHAEPWALTPGQKVIFHYDEQGHYKTQEGVIEGVVYVFNEEMRTHTYIYGVMAYLTLRLSPETFDA